MIILIDGYNILKQLSSQVHISYTGRLSFVKKLSTYAQKKGHKIIVVFDAGPYDFVSKESYKGVTVIYSGMRLTADDYIQDYLNSQVSGRDNLLLVTSDRALCASAEACQVQTMGALVFYTIMQEVLQKKKEKSEKGQQLVKLSHDTNEQLDRLMEEASRIIPVKDELEDSHKPLRHKDKTLSKKERMQQKIVKKL